MRHNQIVVLASETPQFNLITDRKKKELDAFCFQPIMAPVTAYISQVILPAIFVSLHPCFSQSISFLLLYISYTLIYLR